MKKNQLNKKHSTMTEIEILDLFGFINEVTSIFDNGECGISTLKLEIKNEIVDLKRQGFTKDDWQVQLVDHVRLFYADNKGYVKTLDDCDTYWEFHKQYYSPILENQKQRNKK